MKAQSANSSRILRCISLLYIVVTWLLVLQLMVIHRILLTPYYTNTKQVELTIPYGTSGKQVAEILHKNNIIEDEDAFVLFTNIINHSTTTNHTIKAGRYSFQQGTSLIDAWQKMIRGDELLYNVTIPEGKTIAQTISILSNLPSIDISLINSIHLNDGDILPDTYHYRHNEPVGNIITQMREEITSFIMVEWESRDVKIDQYIKTPEEAIILASIVESESMIDEERPMVAGVYINRLKAKMPLQACPTVIYAITDKQQSSGRTLSISDLQYKSPYNTYIHRGLPPGAICNPGRASIIAVLHPVWHDKLYFVADNNNHHILSRTFKEHKLAIKQIRSRK